MSLKDDEEKHVRYARIENIKFTSYSDPNKVVDELFDLLRWRYQDNLETLMWGIDYFFDSVQLMHCKCQKGNFRPGASYIGSLKCIKTKKATINWKNKDNKCF